MAVHPFMGSKKFYQIPKDQVSMGFFHRDPKFVFVADWEDLLVDGIRDPTREERNLPYLSREIFEGTDYYESSFVCPYCSQHELYIDGHQVIPLLWKLKLEPTQSRFEGKPIELYNLFTCCNCNRYFASIRLWDGKAVIDIESFMPSSLSDFALHTGPVGFDEWLELFNQSLNLIPIDSYTDNTD